MQTERAVASEESILDLVDMGGSGMTKMYLLISQEQQALVFYTGLTQEIFPNKGRGSSGTILNGMILMLSAFWLGNKVLDFQLAAVLY